MAEFAYDSDVWVAGAYCRPDDTVLEMERYYWETQNKGRLLESDGRTSSIVIAQCYAFRRALMDRFPGDVVADDIYVAFLCNVLRRRTLYSRKALAVETRGPTSYAQFLPHKFRKSNAFLRETLRFVYRLPEVGPFCKMLLLTKIMQQLLLPLSGCTWLLLAGVLVTLRRYDIAGGGALLLLLLLLLTSAVFSTVSVPEEKRRYSVLTTVKVYVVTNVIMLATGITYPFFRQGSSYSRIGGNG
jgi:hypothetical protein